jgi:O-antigen ligase
MLLGNGLGSAAAINQVYFLSNIASDWEGLTNPHSNMVRLLSETGVAGLLIYIVAFYAPVKKATAYLPTKIQGRLISTSLLVLSLTLGHRSSACFIFLGILFASLNAYFKPSVPNVLKLNKVAGVY